MANTLNDHDLKALYGITLTKAPVDFIKYPDRKDSVSHDWPEKNGIDIDLDEPRFKARTFTLNCALIAENRAEFKSKYAGLFTELKSLDTHALYLETLDQTFQVYYISQSNLVLASKFTIGEVGMQFDLLFGETDPDDNIDTVYLVDDTDNFIIA